MNAFESRDAVGQRWTRYSLVDEVLEAVDQLLQFSALVNVNARRVAGAIRRGSRQIDAMAGLPSATVIVDQWS